MPTRPLRFLVLALRAAPLLVVGCAPPEVDTDAETLRESEAPGLA